jgi:ligand-binding sensor domain-containing protein
MINPFLNQINVSVFSLAWSSKRQTIFAGTESKLWIQSYDAGNEGWRFEHITGLIDAPITSLVYNDVQDKLWIGQSTGITLLSPIIMPTGRLHWFFSRLAGQWSSSICKYHHFEC